jgi:hypothetical protein
MALKEGAHKQDQVQIKKMMGAGATSKQISTALKIRESIVIKFMKWFEDGGDKKHAEDMKEKIANHTATQTAIRETEAEIKEEATKRVLNKKQ